jgi:hypothetical protein
MFVLSNVATAWLWMHRAGDMTNMSLSVANMLRNIVEALEETKAPLQHVYTTLGGEYRAVVGMHTGPVMTGVHFVHSQQLAAAQKHAQAA